MTDFVRQSINGLTMIFYTISDKLQTNDVCVFPELYILVYADDTIKMAVPEF